MMTIQEIEQELTKHHQNYDNYHQKRDTPTESGYLNPMWSFWEDAMAKEIIIIDRLLKQYEIKASIKKEELMES